MVYFNYCVPGSLCPLFGTGENQLLETLKFFGKSIEGPISRVEEIETAFFLPLAGTQHWISAPVLDDVLLHVNANAYSLLMKQLENPEFCGQLYFFTRSNVHGIFLPETVVTAMRNYDWNQHSDSVSRMLLERERALCSLEQNKKVLLRPVPVMSWNQGFA